jgi:hypothetical protein
MQSHIFWYQWNNVWLYFHSIKVWQYFCRSLIGRIWSINSAIFGRRRYSMTLIDIILATTLSYIQSKSDFWQFPSNWMQYLRYVCVVSSSMLMFHERSRQTILSRIESDRISAWTMVSYAHLLSDGNQTISFHIIKNSYNQPILTEMVALKSNNALNLCEIVNKIWNDRIRYEMAFLR